MRKLKVGSIYQHFKGNRYKVVAEALDSETHQPVVIYTSLNDNQTWVRPKTMFLETIERDGKTFERFAEVQS